jgi:thiosulfate/3-mercaptopyruvate sulfurtransferase
VDLEPRPSIPSGHMPHSISVPFNNLLIVNRFNGDTYTALLPPSELRSALVRSFSASSMAEGERTLQRILGGQQPVVVSCGSGMTAAIIWLALQELGTKGKVALYDEVRPVSGPSNSENLTLPKSWTGYAQRRQSTILR